MTGCKKVRVTLFLERSTDSGLLGRFHDVVRYSLSAQSVSPRSGFMVDRASQPPDNVEKRRVSLSVSTFFSISTPALFCITLRHFPRHVP